MRLYLAATRRLGFLFTLLLPVQGAAADVTRGVDADTGLANWRLVAGDARFELIQRLPDQTRGFFEARHFPAAVADEIARSCIFQTIIRNTGAAGSGTAVAVDLVDWRVVHDGKEDALRLKETWLAAWPDAEVGRDAKLAFRWAMFPTRQEFLPGDYNWGMTAFGLAPGAVFDLRLVWRSGGRAESGWIRGIECAPDVEKLK
jgi:hypothetical protein